MQRVYEENDQGKVSKRIVTPASSLKSTDPQQNWHTSLLKEQNQQGHLLIVLWI